MKSNRNKINISENSLNKIISECIKRRLNESFDDEETLDKFEARRDLEYLCHKYRLNFLDMIDNDGTFGVASKVDPETKEPIGDLDGFEEYMRNYEELGRVEKIKERTYLKFGAFVVQYKILAKLV